MDIHLVKRIPFRSDVLCLHSGKLLSHSQCFPKGSLLLLSPGRFLLCHRGSRPLRPQFDVLLLNEGIHCFPDMLAALKTRRFQVAHNVGVPDSHSSHTRYQRVKIRTNPLSQLGDDFSCLSLRQAMCVSVSKSTPPLDFQVRRSKYCRYNTSSAALSRRTTIVRQ